MFSFKKNKMSILSIKIQLKYVRFSVYNPIYMQIKQFFILDCFSETRARNHAKEQQE